MQKTILLTGATDGHHILMHGRNAKKLDSAVLEVASINRNAVIEAYVADLSNLDEVKIN